MMKHFVLQDVPNFNKFESDKGNFEHHITLTKQFHYEIQD